MHHLTNYRAESGLSSPVKVVEPSIQDESKRIFVQKLVVGAIGLSLGTSCDGVERISFGILNSEEGRQYKKKVVRYFF